MDKGPVRLRGHHLLCMLSYVGEGYTPEFVKNFDHIIDRINAGSQIDIVTGLDNVCAALHCGSNGDYKDADHCFAASTLKRDETALHDIGRHLGRLLSSGEQLSFSPENINNLREKFRDGSLRPACKGCEWYDLCSGIAGSGYVGVKLVSKMPASS